MSLVLDATPGGSVANSYETVVEAQAYFDSRLPIAAWDNAESQAVLLVMGTRVLDALAQPFKTFFPAMGGAPAYYRVRRQWTGSPATPTQKLAWPRVGMYDRNNVLIDVGIVSNTVAAATVISTYPTPHRLVSGAMVLVFGDATSTPTINGTWTVTVVDAYGFSIPLTVTMAGTGARFSIIPQELKDATAELAGQLGTTDRTLDNDVIVQGITAIKAGSVGLNFKQAIVPQVIPDAVYNLLPQSWLTDELYVLANQAFIDVITDDPSISFSQEFR